MTLPLEDRGPPILVYESPEGLRNIFEDGGELSSSSVETGQERMKTQKKRISLRAPTHPRRRPTSALTGRPCTTKRGPGDQGLPRDNCEGPWGRYPDPLTNDPGGNRPLVDPVTVTKTEVVVLSSKRPQVPRRCFTRGNWRSSPTDRKLETTPHPSRSGSTSDNMTSSQPDKSSPHQHTLLAPRSVVLPPPPLSLL